MSKNQLDIPLSDKDVCKKCKGTGILRTSWLAKGYPKPCLECKGSGELWRRVYTE